MPAGGLVVYVLKNSNAQGRTYGTPLPRLTRATGPTKSASSSVRLLHLSQKYLPTRSPIVRFTMPCSHQPVPLRIRRSGHLPPSACPHLALLAPTSCPSHTPPAPLAPCSRSPTHLVGCAARLYWRWWCRRVLQVNPHRAKGTHEAWPVPLVLTRCYSAPTPTSRPKSTGPDLSLPLCYKCKFQVFQMLSEVCCKSFIWMMQKYIIMLHMLQVF
jgi:hypothetical protein